MLRNLHVKNLALIDEAEVDFEKGLNILTGETGAGKSIIIGSINLALGEKVSKEMLRDNEENAFVELIFDVESDALKKALSGLDVYPEDDMLILSRKISGGRSIAKINGESVPASKMKAVSALLIDIHGQHEHQSLLYPEKQMEILDAYGKEEIQKKREQVQKDYETYKALRKELEQYEIDEEQKKRQMDFLAFEISEIEDAKLKVGEDEELEAQYRKMINAKRITESLSEVYELTGYEREGSSEQIGRAVRQLSQVSELDDDLKGIYETLNDIDALLSDFNRELSSYLSGFQFSQEEFLETEERLNLLNHLKSKYGASIEAVLEYKQEKEEEYEALEHFEQNQAELKRKIEEQETVLQKQCECLTKSRKKWAKSLEKEIIEGLQELNFLDVAFEIVFEEKAEFSSNGKDSICFFISTNPGEPKRELQKVVSGGELSRIMLAIKTILADKDEKETLIFDEIDTGISGKTAWKVSEKMAVIAKSHQVLCITHLPQIAAQADSHFLIEKSVKELETQTKIWRLDEEKSVEELARMLGGESITETVLSNAREMKEMAQQQKNTRVK